MRNDDAFLKIFWGFLLVWVDFYFFTVDVFTDPIGFYLIYSGIKLIVDEYPIGKKAEVLSIVLTIYSAPSVLYIRTNDSFPGVSFSAIDWYYTIMDFAVLILIFYIFQLILDFTKNVGMTVFHKRSLLIGIIYFIVNFVILIWSTFTINVNLDSFTPITLILLIAGVVMHIVFLVLLDEVRKIKAEPH